MPTGYPKSKPGPWQFAASLRNGARTADTVIGSVAATLQARLKIIEDEATHIRRALVGLGVLSRSKNGAEPPADAAQPELPLPARKGKAKRKGANAGRIMPKNEIPLRKLAVQILEDRGPLTTQEIADEALARGYKTLSPNFGTVVLAGMSQIEGVKRRPDNRWALTKPPSRSVQRRQAVQKGKPTPLFGGKSDTPTGEAPE